ncbi:MAG TPA: histidine kinase, partial [Anaerolineaceae bacterium]
MNRSITGSYGFIFYLTAALLFAAVSLRSLLIYSAFPGVSARVMLLLAAWLILLLSEPAVSRLWQGYFPIYLTAQLALVTALLFNPEPSDYFAIFLAVLSMQMMPHVKPKTGFIIIAAFAPLIFLPLSLNSGLPTAITFVLIYTGANAFFASYSLASQRAMAARARYDVLTRELEANNRQLEAYSTQLEQLAVARERSRLARELHDSVTQTVFSMTLTVQSALMLLDSHPEWVKSQLSRLNELAQSAQAEMQTLISQLRPESLTRGGLAATLRRHLADRRLPEGLSVSLEAEGTESLSSAEEQGLFRIAQEALNNIVKHSHASRACLHLNLVKEPWIEIEDNGQG